MLSCLQPPDSPPHYLYKVLKLNSKYVVEKNDRSLVYTFSTATNVKMAIFFIVESSDALVRNGTRSTLPGRNVTKDFLVFRRSLKVTQPVLVLPPNKVTKVIISDRPICKINQNLIANFHFYFESEFSKL